MKFMAIKDLRARTAALRKDLERGEEVVVTANGRPIALLTPVDGDTLEQEVRESRRARARAALARTRARAAAVGTSRMQMADVHQVVAAARKARQP